MKNRYLSLLLIGVVLVAGCTASQVDLYLKASPAVQGFLSQYPNAKIATSLISQVAVVAQLEEIKKDCEDFQAGSYYKTTINDEASGTKLTVWMDAKNYQVVCAVKETQGVKTPVANAPATTSIPCTKENFWNCKTESDCKAAGANWCGSADTAYSCTLGDCGGATTTATISGSTTTFAAPTTTTTLCGNPMIITLDEKVLTNVTVGGINYTITLDAVTGATAAYIKVGSSGSTSVTKGNTYTIGGLTVYVKDLIFTTKTGDKSSAILLLGDACPTTTTQSATTTTSGTPCDISTQRYTLTEGEARNVTIGNSIYTINATYIIVLNTAYINVDKGLQNKYDKGLAYSVNVAGKPSITIIVKDVIYTTRTGDKSFVILTLGYGCLINNLPDLSIDATDVVCPGNTANPIKLTIKNKGNAAAIPFNVSLYGDPTLKFNNASYSITTPAGSTYGIYTILGISAGSQYTILADATLNGGSLAGKSFNLTAYVDGDQLGGDTSPTKNLDSNSNNNLLFRKQC